MAKHGILLELFYDGQWNPAPTYNKTEIQIARGCDDEQADPTPASMLVAIKNRSGDYNPRNPLSTLYGKIGRNTPARLTIDDEFRMNGEVASWKPKRTLDFTVDGQGDAWTDVVVTGVLRRIGQGSDSRSALYRANAAKGPLVLWPMEDGVDASLAASGIPGGVPLVINAGVIDFETEGGPVGSSGYARVREVPTDVLTANLPAYTDVGDGWQASIWAKATGTYAGGTVGASYDEVSIMKLFTTDGYEWRFGMSNNYGGGVSPMFVSVFDPAGDFVDGAINPAEPAVPGFLGGDWHLFEIRVEQASPTEIDLQLFSDGNIVDTVSGITCSGVPTRLQVLGSINFIEAEDIGVAHIMVRPTNTGFTTQWDAGLGWSGETAATRVGSLADERGVGFTLVGDLVESQPMGAQYPDTTTNLLAEAQRTDSGMLFDSRDELGLTYRTGRNLYAQAPALELQFGAVQLEPVLDDQATRNDVTVNRREGSSARAVQEVGPMNVQDPEDDPEGVGRTVATVDINPDTDAVLPNHASWHLHFGTVDEIRYPQVTVDLDGKPELAAAVSAVDIGDVITIANLPADISPDLARLIVLGYTETVSLFRRKITFNCAPASPYDVGIWDDPDTPTSARWDSATSETVGAITTGTSSSVSVATEAGSRLWTTDPTHFPFDVNLLGARVRLNAPGEALNDNPFLGVNATGWTGINGTAVYSTAVRRRPEYGSLLVTPSGAGIAEARTSALIGGIMAGGTYRLGGWLYTPGAWASGHRVGVNWYTAAGVFLTTSQTPTAVLVAGDWTWVGVEATAPATATQARLWANQQGAATATNIWYATGLVLTPLAFNDAFDRTGSSGWANGWTNSGGSAADYSTNGSDGLISMGTLNVSRRVWRPETTPEQVDLLMCFRINRLGATDDIEVSLACQMLDQSTYVHLGLFLDGDGSNADLQVVRRVAGTPTTISNIRTLSAFQAINSDRWLRMRAAGGLFYGKAWSGTIAAEPADWLVAGSDGDSGPGQFGVRTSVQPSYSGATPVVLTVKQFTATTLAPQTFTISSTVVNGVEKSIPSGAPVRLWQPARYGL